MAMRYQGLRLAIHHHLVLSLLSAATVALTLHGESLNCNLAADPEVKQYVSSRVRYFFNSTENDTQNSINIAVAKGDEARGEILAVLLREIFRYPDARVVDAEACHYPFDCAIKLNELRSVGGDYLDSGFLYLDGQKYYYASSEHQSCALSSFGSGSESDQEYNFPIVSTMIADCGSANDIRDFSHLSVGGFAHLSRRQHQQKKLLLTGLAGYDTQLGEFLRDFALNDTAPTRVGDVCGWLLPALKHAAPSQWNLKHMSTQLMPLTVALLWPNGHKLNDSSVLTAAVDTMRQMNRPEANVGSHDSSGGGGGSVSCEEAPAHLAANASQANYRMVAACALRAAGLRLELVQRGMDCDKADALQFFSEVTCSSTPVTPLIAMIAGTCSETVGPIAELSSQTRSVVVSPTVESVVFSDVVAYPYFFRTVPSMAAYSETVIKYLKNESWPDVALLSSGKLFLRRDEFQREANGLNVCLEEVADEETLTLPLTIETLSSGKAKKCQVYAMDYLKRGTCLYLCAAYKLQMLQRENYLFILANRAKDVFVNKSVACENTTALLADNPNGCTPEEIKEAADGHVIVQNHLRTADSGFKVAGPDGKLDASRFDMFSSSFFYNVYTMHSVQLLAQALARVVQIDPSAVYHINSPGVAALFREALENTTFKNFQLSKNHGIDRGYMMVVLRRFFKVGFTDKLKKFFAIDKPEVSIRISKIKSVADNSTTVVSSAFLSQFHWRQTGPSHLPQVTVALVGHSSTGHFATLDGRFIKRFSVEDNCATAFMRVFDRNLTCPQTIVGLIVGIFFVCLVALFCVFIGLLRYYRRHEVEKLVQPFQQLRDRLADVEIPKQQVVLNRKMGKGCFGTVYGGEVNLPAATGGISGWTSCAVKVMNDDLKQEAIMQFLEEAATLSQFTHERHDNIVQLLGVSTTEQPYYIIMEMCLHGDLKSFLMARRTQALTKTAAETCPGALTQYAVDIARGIQYLHKNNMVHRDLALRNCMINDKFQVKVGDFGLARFIKEYYRVQHNKLVPVRWMPPESIQYMYFTTHSDIWSYAIVLYEIVTFGKFPFQELSQQQVISQVSRGLTLFSAFPADATQQLRALVGRCWQFEPKDRPGIGDVLEVLADSPECVTACLDEAPPHQPLEALSVEHLHLRGLTRHTSGDGRSAAARDASSGASIGLLSDSAKQINSLSMNSTFSGGVGRAAGKSANKVSLMSPSDQCGSAKQPQGVSSNHHVTYHPGSQRHYGLEDNGQLL